MSAAAGQDKPIAADSPGRPIAILRLLGGIHRRLVYRRRVDVLAQHLAALIPTDGRVLDIGCGDVAAGTIEK